MTRCTIEAKDGKRIEVDARASHVDGVAITDPVGNGKTWQLTHVSSGKRISKRTWPTYGVANQAARAWLAGLDWTVDADAMTEAHRIAAKACEESEV